MENEPKGVKGRGAEDNLPNRFEALHIELEESREGTIKTEFLRDSSRAILSENDSPDIPFRYSLNPYRGCEHGCIYCYARPTHEYLGFSPGLDFETKIVVKDRAPELLRERLMKPSWKGESITMSGNTDCYQPVERKLRITRSCLEVLAEFRNPVGLITKNYLITRDRDILSELASFDAALVFISVTSLDSDLAALLEPRTSRPPLRLQAIRELSEAGIPVGVNVAPVIPGLTDHEMPAILKAAREAGARFAGFTSVRLPLAVAPLFERWLETHKPDRKNKVMNLIKSMHGGRANDPRFGSRMRGEGPIAENLRQMFKLHTRKLGLNVDRFELSSREFRRPTDQLSLF